MLKLNESKNSNFLSTLLDVENNTAIFNLISVTHLLCKNKNVENNDFSPFLVIESSGSGVQETGTLNFHLSIKTEKSQKVGDFLKKEKRKSLLKVKKLS